MARGLTFDAAPRRVYGQDLPKVRYRVQALGESGDLAVEGSPKGLATKAGVYHSLVHYWLAENHAAPRLMTTAPNKVWTLDATDLGSPNKGEYDKLYVVLDFYGRYVVAWMPTPRTSGTPGKNVIAAACRRHLIRPRQLRSHGDGGRI